MQFKLPEGKAMQNLLDHDNAQKYSAELNARKKGCSKATMVILLVFILSPCLIARIFPVLIGMLRWNSRGSGDYQITLRPFGYSMLGEYLIPNTDTVVTVHDGQVIRACAERLPWDRSQFNSFQRFSVPGLFGVAASTLFNPFLAAEYDDYYGYPVQIGGGFIEGGGLFVVNLHFLFGEASTNQPSSWTCIP
jgi:hypothetical protein